MVSDIDLRKAIAEEVDIPLSDDDDTNAVIENECENDYQNIYKSIDDEDDDD